MNSILERVGDGEGVLLCKTVRSAFSRCASEVGFHEGIQLNHFPQKLLCGFTHGCP